MQIKNWKILFALSLFAASCSQNLSDEQQPAGKKITATIGSEPGIGLDVRTELGDDGITLMWAQGDIVSLWAKSSDGNMQFADKPFGLWHYNANFNSAKFTAEIDPMPEDTYTYYAVSPRPNSVSGMQATYVIPSEQQGVFDGSCAVMVAAPTQGSALHEGDNSDLVSLKFTHKIHILKIRIPENKMGIPVTALELTFPQPVTGRLTVDTADPAAAPVLTDGSNILTLKFKQPIDVGSTVFAVIAPVELTSADRIEIKAYTEKKESRSVKMAGKNFQEGHTTPIALTIPEVYRITHIAFSIDGDGTQTLGEKVNSFKLTAPEGVDLGEGTNVRTFTINDQNEYTLSYEGDFVDNLSGKILTATFDSDNAAVTLPVTIPQIIPDERNDLPKLRIPYLFEEDFSTIGDYSYGDNNSINATSAGSNTAQNFFTEGWTGARCGSKAQQSIRICSRTECAARVYGAYHGRVDSPDLTNIKEGRTIRISVSFTYSFARNAVHNNFIQPYMAFGVTTDSNRNTEGKVGSNSDYLKALIPDIIQSDLNDAGALSGSFGNVAIEMNNALVQNVTRGHRLVWDVYTKENEPKEWVKYYYSNNYAYIDNIKVSIAQ